MKYFSFFIVLFALISCNSNDDKEVAEIETVVESNELESQEITKPQNSEVKPGEYFEYHESGGIKIRGFYNDDLTREGLWLSYYENGIKWSEAYYSAGKRDGHNITFYPSGKIRFVGEYKDDKKTGTWTFYDETGAVTKVENF
jgi:antitoxin component YwqK of YwqJK toxin-antitoxin module